MKNKYRSKQGLLLTQGLFYGMTGDNSKAIYTLDHEDLRKGARVYYSIWRLYSLYSDPTEYKFAVDHFESMEHWERVKRTPWFKQAGYDSARKDLKARIASESVEKIKKMESFQAQKWLHDEGYEKQERGRPSKAEVTKKAKEMAETQTEVDQDYERLMSAGAVQ